MSESPDDRDAKRRRLNECTSSPRDEDENEESEDTESEEEEEEEETCFSERIAELRSLLRDMNKHVPQECMEEFEKLRERCMELEQLLKKKKVCLFGTNGTGKSYLINLWLMVTSCLPSEYRQWNEKGSSTKGEMADDTESQGKKDKKEKVIYNDMSSREIDIESIKEKYTEFVNPAHGKTQKAPVYLLPSQNRGFSTTPCSINLVHSKCFYMLVEYLSKEELLEDAGPWIACQRGGNLAKRDAKLKSMRERYDAVVADEFRTTNGKIPAHVLTTDDIKIRPELEKYAGCRHRYSGRGKDLHNDRQFIRDKLHDLLQQDIFITCVKSVEIGAPSSILEEVDQITDCPGTDDENTYLQAATKAAIEQHEVIVILADRSLNSRTNIIEFLCSSDFMRNMVKFPKHYQLVVFMCTENERDGIKNHQLIIENSTSDLQQMHDGMIRKSKKYLDEILFDCCIEEGLTEDEAAKRVQEINGSIIYSVIYPSLYAGIEFDKQWREENADQVQRIFSFIDCSSLLGIFQKTPAKILSEYAPRFYRDIETFMDLVTREGILTREQIKLLKADEPILQAAEEFKNKYKLHRKSEKAALEKLKPLSDSLDKYLSPKIEEAKEIVKTFIEHDDGDSVQRNFVEWFQNLIDETTINKDNKAWMSSKWVGRGDQCSFYLEMSRFWDNALLYSKLKQALTQFLSKLIPECVSRMEDFMQGDFFPEYKKSKSFKLLLKKYTETKLCNDQFVNAKEKFFSTGATLVQLSESNFKSRVLREAQLQAIKTFLKRYEKDANQLEIDEYKEKLKAGASQLFYDLLDGCTKLIMKKVDVAWKAFVNRVTTVNKALSPKCSLLIACYEFADYILEESGKERPFEGKNGMDDIAALCTRIKKCIPQGCAEEYEEVVCEEISKAILRRRLHRELDTRQRQHGNLLLGPSLKSSNTKSLRRDDWKAETINLPLQFTQRDMKNLLKQLEGMRLKVWPSPEDVKPGANDNMCLFKAIALSRWEVTGSKLKEIVDQLKVAFCMEMERCNKTPQDRAAFAKRYSHVIPKDLDWTKDWKSYLDEAEEDGWAGDFLCLTVIHERLFSRPANALVWCPGKAGPLQMNEDKRFYNFAVLSQERMYDFRIVTAKKKKLEELEQSESDRRLRSHTPCVLMLVTLKVLDDIGERFEDLCRQAMECNIKIYIPEFQMNTIRTNAKQSTTFGKIQQYIVDMSTRSNSLFKVESREHRPAQRYESNNNDLVVVHARALESPNDYVVVVALEKEAAYRECKEIGIPVFTPGVEGKAQRNRLNSCAGGMSELLRRLMATEDKDPKTFFQEEWSARQGFACKTGS